LITYSDKNCIKQKFIENDASDNRSVSVRKITDDNLHESLVSELKSLLNNGGIAGIIVNTVKRAQEIYNACVGEFSDEEVMVIHSQFIATDRVRKEQQICNMIGKNAHRPIRAIIIGTQVLEQSLDVDFDVLFTDLAPIDLLL
ncbi:CRISPR-associated helicase/endonuclease Cas3, partial [Bifidobacteriaceae bacterium WP022]